MNNRSHTLVLALLLMVLGLSIFAFKVLRLGLPLEPDSESKIWTIEARLAFDGGRGTSKASMKIPNSPVGYDILNENFVSRGYGLATNETQSIREAVWSRRRAAGPQALYYRVSVYQDPTASGKREEVVYPSPPELEEPYATALEVMVTNTRAQSADIASFASQMLRRINNPAPDEDVELFLTNPQDKLEKARVAQLMLSGARIPSQIAHGITLRGEPHSATLTSWLEVYNGDRWLYFDPMTANQFEPTDLFTWYYGDSTFVNVTNARNIETQLSVQRDVVDSLAIAERRAARMGSHAMEFSLFELPIRTQAVYAVLLLIPLGAVVMVIMRNIVGVPTFGMFTPILIALAFRETRLVYGLILFTLVVSLGLIMRFYLEKLHLLLAPRLAAVLTVVVLLLVAISVLSNRLDLENGLSVALFPMVILTMVIERMSIVWDERGPSTAIKEGLGSLIVAMTAYFVMSIDRLEHLLFVFPELLLIVLGVCLLLGRYTGYRISELIRFKALADKSS